LKLGTLNPTMEVNVAEATTKEKVTKAYNVLDRMLDPQRREEVIKNYMADFNLSREEAVRQLEQAGF
jgi:hypothetical protein